MNQAEIIAAFRVEADDAVAPYLVSDAKLALWLTEAEREGAERSRYIRTGTSDNITLVIGQAAYALAVDIIQLDSIQVAGETSPLTKIDRRLLDGVATASGVPTHYFFESNSLTVFPTPLAVGTLNIYGRRLPRTALTETPTQLHESLIFWLLYRYYSIRDADIYSPQLAAENLARFQDVFGFKKPAWLRDMQKSAAEINHFRVSPIK